MTISDDARRTNVKEALIAFLSDMADQEFVGYKIEQAKYPRVLKTTWTELENDHLIKDTNTQQIILYEFTQLGYVQALKVSGRSDKTEFHKELGKICSVLKGSLKKGRTHFGRVVLQDLVNQAGVSEAFARNAIDGDLIQNVLGRVGAQWDGQSNIIRVPNNFYHTPI